MLHYSTATTTATGKRRVLRYAFEVDAGDQITLDHERWDVIDTRARGLDHVLIEARAADITRQRADLIVPRMLSLEVMR